ncbi:hypothetical protein GGR57DRAFT_482405 [Xylariaceae sp. FL1272]|nr:hypothetical protein GGR57DRAFT_482405 [Xylariaceae sp. FL1272]
MDAAGDMPFILSTGKPDKKSDVAERKLIRRHVMIGKNRGKVFPNRKKPNKNADPEQPVARGEARKLHLHPQTIACESPRRVGGELSCVALGDSVDTSVVETVIQFTNFAKTAMFPLEPCINFPKKDVTWLEPMLGDAAHLHTMIFTTHSFFDMLRFDMPKPVDQSGSPHYAKAMKLLRERIAGENTDDIVKKSTLSIIISLAMHALLQGDHEAAHYHVLGLKRIVELRGGLRPLLWHSPNLLMELLRTDIVLALYANRSPVFFQDTVQDPPWPYPRDMLAEGPIENFAESASSTWSGTRFTDLDPEVARAWRALEVFSSQLNSALKTRTKLSKESLLEIIVSSMYRLVAMKFPLGSLSEMMRQAVLAYGYATFIHWSNHIRPMGGTLYPATYRQCITRFEQAGGSPRIILWALMIGVNVIFTEEDMGWLDPMLRSHIDLYGGGTFAGTKILLHGFMWVGFLHDRSVKRVFARLYPDSIS